MLSGGLCGFAISKLRFAVIIEPEGDVVKATPYWRTRLFQRGAGWSALTRNALQGARTRRFEQLLRIQLGVDQETHEAILHLFPVLEAPDDFLIRIGIEFVVRRIVVMRDALDAGAFGQHHRLLQVVT